MSCKCCRGRSKWVTTEDRPCIHGRMTVTARYYWLSDTGWSWCPEQVTRVVLHAYGADIEIAHLLNPIRKGDFHLVDADLWNDLSRILDDARMGLEEPNIKQEMLEEKIMMEDA